MDNLWINGEWERGKGAQFSSLDPANNDVIWRGHEASHDQVNHAIKSARSAFKEWMLRPYEERLQVVKQFAEQLKKNEAQLTQTLSKEVGKPLWEAATEIKAMTAKANISDKAYHARSGRVSSSMGQATATTRHKPHGVFVVIGPYNFPAHLPNGHIIPALLAGNTVILKPSSQTPLIAEAVMHCWQATDLPKGVINLIQGTGSIGQKLLSSTSINGLLFTGSYKTGVSLNKHFAAHPEIILALEMGGNNPLVVTDIDDIQTAAYYTIQSAFITAGQRCTCARRLIVPEGGQGDEFIQALVNMTSNIKVGHYTEDPEPFMGPVISKKIAQQLIMAQDDFSKRGAKVLKPLERLVPETGLLAPGIMDVTGVEERYDTEFFGPLLQVIRVADFEAAIIEANNTNYGLSAGLFSNNAEEFKQFYQHVNAGVINWNQQLTGASSAQPFGGVGFSGNHRPSAFYAADYCAYPVASLEAERLIMPETITPGITIVPSAL